MNPLDFEVVQHNFQQVLLTKLLSDVWGINSVLLGEQVILKNHGDILGFPDVENFPNAVPDPSEIYVLVKDVPAKDLILAWRRSQNDLIPAGAYDAETVDVARCILESRVYPQGWKLGTPLKDFWSKDLWEDGCKFDLWASKDLLLRTLKRNSAVVRLNNKKQ